MKSILTNSNAKGHRNSFQIPVTDKLNNKISFTYMFKKLHSQYLNTYKKEFLHDFDVR